MRLTARITVLIGMILIALGVVLIGCTPDKSAPTLEPIATIPSNEAAEPEAIQVAAVGTPIVEVPPFTDTECLDCHTDQQALIELAVEEENVHESLSSGPG